MPIKSLLCASIAFLVGLLAFAAPPAIAAFSAWPAYHPSPGVSIALDAAAREHVDSRQPGILSRFSEFARRALTHDEFTAGHFDPGRMPA
jgi:hypothetical protein